MKEKMKALRENEKAKVLYENTGISKYIVRNFQMDISTANHIKIL